MLTNRDALGPSAGAAATPSKRLARPDNRLHIGVFPSGPRIHSPLLGV